jgi:hypothetical protein
MKSGTYRIYALIHGDGDPQEVLMGRFMVHGNNFITLEDHDGLISNELPDGPIGHLHDKFVHGLDNSGYFKLVPEQQIDQGLHDDLVDDVSWDDTNPEARYLLLGPNEEPKRMEMYGHTVVLDGEKLSDDEVKKIVEAVRENKFKLLPV